MILFVHLFLFSCKYNTNNDHLEFTVASDSASFYYKTGWKQIMDEGNYGKAELSYRKMLAFDSDFLVGKSVLARLTTDLNERLSLYNELEQKKNTITGDERLVLDVYIGLTKFTNIREQEPEKAKEVLSEVLSLAEKNLKEIVHKYPKEIYLKSEYIEILYSLYGAKTALDSLKMLTTDAQKENPFLLGYAASMEAELGNYEIALRKGYRLKEIINDSLISKPYTVLADIYLKMNELEKAKMNADYAYLLDPRNLDASRLKIRIDEKLKKP